MKKKLSLLMATAMMISTLAACSNTGKTPEDKPTEEKTPAGTTAEVDTSAEVRGADGKDEAVLNRVLNTLDDTYLADPFDEKIPSHYEAYPSQSDKTLDIWMPIDGFLASIDGDLNELFPYKKAQELTGINVNFISPAAGTEDDAFTIMTSSGDSLPDIVVQADRYPGGIEAGFEDGAYIDLTDKIEEWAPNYHEFRNSNENRRRTTVTDSGKVLSFAGLSPYNEWIWFGLLIKQEALDKTGLPVPETIEEWETFLEKCQEVGYSEPLNYGSTYGQIFTDAFNGAFGVYDWRFIDENKQAHWGPIQENAKEYLALMRRWQERGFFNPDWTSADYNQRMAHASSDKAAVILDSPDTMWGVWRNDNGIEFVGAPNPVLKKGDTRTTTYKNWSWTGNPAAITTQAEDVELAMRWLDFGYSKKGWELFNYGEYGKTHLIDESGMPYYHDESVMFHDPDNHPLSQLIWKYRIHSGPNIRDEHNSNPLIANKESYSGKIREMWTETEDASPAVPPISLTQEENRREVQLGTQLASLRNEYYAKIIMGELPLEAFDEFVEKAKTIGVEEWQQIIQAGVDRFYER